MGINRHGDEAREAGERRKRTVPPCGMGSIVSVMKPAKRAKDESPWRKPWGSIVTVMKPAKRAKER